eukprot:TRINITY_DN1091_c0_g1_i12.p1 TRINITY_DN1091_c0_g1~~TRINITY_DN1091_c0_g1_i12.p1  ORF type:complete len:535 (-),score=147.03 TRINITY_DN1091_c0_g1_i12:183-1589(-)
MLFEARHNLWHQTTQSPDRLKRFVLRKKRNLKTSTSTSSSGETQLQPTATLHTTFFKRRLQPSASTTTTTLSTTIIPPTASPTTSFGRRLSPSASTITTNSTSSSSTTTPPPACLNQTIGERVTRAVILYFPISRKTEYFPEFRWLYRSWLHIQKLEDPKWRTDLIIFIEDSMQGFTELGCTNNTRKTANDPPACYISRYTSLKKRVNPTGDPFIAKLKEELNSYEYVDSILMAFEGYEFLKVYDFVIRSDLDVFLTPRFASWLPSSKCEFHVGRGGYSTVFNTKRMKRIAEYRGLAYAGVENMGSTWYGSPDAVRMVAAGTLENMHWLAKNEFSQPEKEGKLGTILWPFWHFPVILLYGQHMALNDFIGRNVLKVVKSENIMDWLSTTTTKLTEPYEQNTPIHLHVWHTPEMFSKFAFKMGKYDNLSSSSFSTTIVRDYAMHMALDSKNKTLTKLNQILQNIAAAKV